MLGFLIGAVVGFIAGGIVSFVFFRNNPKLKDKADRIADVVDDK